MQKDQNNYYAVIMAGGGGTRLWPLSRKAMPKQMLNLLGDRTMFQIAVDRLDGVFEPEHILVVTVAEQARILKQQCPQIPEENFLIEPLPRGTASVAGYAALAVRHKDTNGIMAILTADHFIEDVAKFQSLLKASAELADEGYLVTMGITPTFPATGYGYIQRAEKMGQYQGKQAYQVASFKEKPDVEKAEEFIAGNDHDWNSGMFIWRVDRILGEIEVQMPQLSEHLAQIGEVWGCENQQQVIMDVWPKIIPQTIDYGIMENADKVAVFPAKGMGWNDVGSWESLFDVLLPDENGNLILGEGHLGLNTQKSLVLNDQAEKLIVTVGLENIIVVQTKDAVLICKREDSQQIKTIVNCLKDENRNEYL